MHEHGELARDSDGSPPEADLLLEFEAPDLEGTVCLGTPQDHYGRFIKQSAQMGVPASGDVAVIIHLSRLVTLGGQSEPGADGSGVLEVARLLDRRHK